MSLTDFQSNPGVFFLFPQVSWLRAEPRKEEEEWELPNPTLLLPWDPAGVQECSWHHPVGSSGRILQRNGILCGLKPLPRFPAEVDPRILSFTPRESHKHWKKPLGSFSSKKRKRFLFPAGKNRVRNSPGNFHPLPKTTELPES